MCGSYIPDNRTKPVETGHFGETEAGKTGGVASVSRKMYFEPMAEQWEYRIIYKDKMSELQIELNSLGKEGWEAVSMERSAYNNSCSALLKRLVSS